MEAYSRTIYGQIFILATVIWTWEPWSRLLWGKLTGMTPEEAGERLAGWVLNQMK